MQCTAFYYTGVSIAGPRYGTSQKLTLLKIATLQLWSANSLNLGRSFLISILNSYQIHRLCKWCTICTWANMMHSKIQFQWIIEIASSYFGQGQTRKCWGLCKWIQSVCCALMTWWNQRRDQGLPGDHDDGGDHDFDDDSDDNINGVDYSHDDNIDDNDDLMESEAWPRTAWGPWWWWWPWFWWW